jgi:hypothetical protein
MATLGTYLNYEHLAPPTRRVIPVPSSPSRSVARTFRLTQIPIAECAALSAHHHPRVRSLAAFGRRPRCKPHHLHGPAQVREMTGWTNTGGFYGAIKRAGLKLTKDASGVYHAA